MKCSEICALIEQEYGTEYACDWDNVGLLAGRSTKEVKKILLSLDATDEVVRMAAEGGYDMLITHHPMLFSAIKRVTDQDMNGRRLLELIRNDISYYAMHTNYDVLGMADLSADYLKLEEREVLSVTEETRDRCEGLGRVGMLSKQMSLRECGEFVKAALSLNDVKIYGDLEQPVHRAAICTGSGKSMISDVLAKGADVYVTGDIDHHTGIDAVAAGLAVIDAGHYGTEYIFMDAMKKKLGENFPELPITCAKVKSPYTIL